MMSKTFKGANVFLSRNLVPPEIFDSLHDVLKHNGADVYLCCDPSRNGPNDYHVISSNHHEKFDDLQKKGCCMLGPQCVFSSAKECRPLPKQCFTCCLAMDGVKVLASGFEMDEKLEIGKMVTAMGGAEHTKASLDVSFVIVKNVLAAKYKWALNVLKKPVVTLSWLHQCWKEHRVVPHEAYRVLPFSGLTICVTKVPAVERKEMEKVVVQNGGNYSAELTRKSPEGDKYKVAKRWGNVLTVTRRWFDQSVARRACLNEESYPVQGGSALLPNGVRTCLSAPHSQDKWVGGSQFVSSSAGDSNLETLFCAADQDLEVTVSQKVSTTYLEGPIYHKEVREVPAVQPRSDISLDGCVADDSQSEDNDLYLADCRILLCGFDASEMRKLVNMVRRGGGSRYMSMNEKLTHIIVGTLSEIEKKEVRGLAAAGVIYLVRPAWLEDCDREKKEAPVLRGHIAYDLLLPKDSICLNKGATVETATMKHFKVSTVQSRLRDDNLQGTTNSGAGTSLEKNNGLEVNINVTNSMRAATRCDTQSQFNAINGKGKDDQKTQVRSCDEYQDMKSSVFVGRLFRFGSSFPQDRRAEIIEWVYLGGGEVVEDQTKQKVHFVVGCHGVMPHFIDASGATNVSSHWIRSCLEDRCLLDIPSHIIYSPLPCRIPLPGFQRFRFCISQYDEKDRLLMRNLCFILGAKFVEKLTKKVTHLLCKFTSGPKYEAACKWGIQSVTCEWIYECVKQNEIVSLGPFCPKEVTSEDQMAGNCTLSQYPTQATKMIASQFAYESKDLGNMQASTRDIGREDRKLNSNCCKRARTLEDECELGQQFSGLNQSDFLSRMTYTGTEIIEKTKGVSDAVPDVAAAIEDLLEQTSKIHDLKSPGRNKCDKSLFSSDCSVLVQEHVDSRPTFGLTDHWINRSNRKSDSCNFSEDANVGIYDGFSETQTESQVVGYEEDLSGRQMIIDRVRTRSSMA